MSSNKYWTVLRSKQYEITCFPCSKTMFPRAYQEHMYDVHKFSKKSKTCIWCEKFVFENQRKEGRINPYSHLITCLKSRSENDRQERDRLVREGHVKVNRDLYLNCALCDEWLKKKHLLSPRDHPLIRKVQSTTAPNILNDIDINASWMAGYEGSVLDDLCGVCSFWVNKFHTLDLTKYAVYHYSVRHWAWEKFFAWANRHTELVCVLPYWCLCSGGENPLAPNCNLAAVHRHSIVIATREGMPSAMGYESLKKAYESIRNVPKPLLPGSKKIHSRNAWEIKTPHHYFNMMRYVSKNVAKCSDTDNETRDNLSEANEYDVTEEEGLSDASLEVDSPVKNSDHFYLAKAMAPHSLLLISICNEHTFQIINTIVGQRTVLPTDQRRGTSDQWERCAAKNYTLRNHLLALRRNLRFKTEMDGDDVEVKGTIFMGEKSIALVDEPALGQMVSHLEWNHRQIETGNIFMQRAEGVMVLLSGYHRSILEATELIRTELADALQMLKQKDAVIQNKDVIIEQKDVIIEQKDADFLKVIQNKDAELQNKDVELRQKDGMIRALTDIIARQVEENISDNKKRKTA